MRWLMRFPRLPKISPRFSDIRGTAFVEALVILPVLLMTTWLFAGVGAGVWGTWVLGQAAENGVLAWQRQGIAAVTPMVMNTLQADGFSAVPTVMVTEASGLRVVHVSARVWMVGWPAAVTLQSARSMAMVADGNLPAGV